jgi:OmcA/MtrC family decaheme c-type cytochrome
LSVLLLAAFLAFSAGCKGDKGSDGAAGEQGETGAAGPTGPIGPAGPQLASVGEEACSLCHGEGGVADVEVMHGLATPAGFSEPEWTALSFDFGNMTVNSGADTSTIQFTITDQTGAAIVLDDDPDATETEEWQEQLEDGRIRIAVAQYTDAASGNAGYWENFVVDEDGEPAYEGSDPDDHAVGTITANGSGSFTYTWENDLSAGGSAGLTFSSSKVIRVAIQTGGGSSPLPGGNYIADYNGLAVGVAEAPAGEDDGQGNVTGTFARVVVDQSSCNDCHNPLQIHGRRTNTKYCPVCHNPSLAAGDGDLKVMVHKIHRGRYLANGFEIGGHDYSEVGWPMFPLEDGLGIQNCTKCHDNTVAADADNWKTVPTMETCGACHDDVVFADGASGGHNGGPQSSNANCANSGCHGAGEDLAPDSVHNVPALLTAALNTLDFNIISATYSESSGAVTVNFSFTNPSDSDSAYDIATADAFNTENGASINLSVAWDSSTDFSNEGSGSTPARSLDTSVLGSLGTSAITDNEDGTYTMVVDLPDEAQASGSGMVFLQGHPLGDIDGDGTIEDAEEMPTTSVSMFFAINDSSASERREVVDIDKCDSCHGILSLHGENRNDNINVCAACHNPNHTDINRRPEDATDAADGKGEESIDFKRLIHAVHASGMREEPLVVYGFGGSTHVFDEEEVAFPGELDACDSCHAGDSFTLPLADDILASTIDSGDDAADPADDLNITQNAAVCSSCHDGEKAQTHMQQNGAAFDVLDENILFY